MRIATRLRNKLGGDVGSTSVVVDFGPDIDHGFTLRWLLKRRNSLCFSFENFAQSFMICNNICRCTTPAPDVRNVLCTAPSSSESWPPAAFPILVIDAKLKHRSENVFSPRLKLSARVGRKARSEGSVPSHHLVAEAAFFLLQFR